MKKLINTSFFYAMAAIVGGVYFRELTRIIGYTGATKLSFLHLHMFTMGMLFFLIAAICERLFSLSSHRRFKLFYILYNVGLGGTVACFAWRGTMQALELNISSAMSASISGISGILHTILTVALVLFFIILKKQAAK